MGGVIRSISSIFLSSLYHRDCKAIERKKKNFLERLVASPSYTQRYGTTFGASSFDSIVVPGFQEKKGKEKKKKKERKRKMI